jgi:hypothetical protein
MSRGQPSQATRPIRHPGRGTHDRQQRDQVRRAELGETPAQRSRWRLVTEHRGRVFHAAGWYRQCDGAELVSTAANLGGLGFGALLAGFLAEYAASPLMLPYLVAEGLMLAGAIALAAAPETVARPDRRPRYHPQRVRIPADQRQAFYAAGLAAAAAFALFGLFTSLAPGFIAGTLHQSSHALAGLSTFIVFGAAALAQMSVGRLPLSRGLQARLGLGVLAAGVAAVTAAVWLPSLALFLVGGAVAGAGAGAAFKTSITTVLSIAPAGARGAARPAASRSCE